MMPDIYSALLFGLSFSNIWICALVIFSLQTSDRYTGIGYIAGRFVGIVGLLLLLNLAGHMVKISSAVIDIFSGITLLIFAMYLIIKYGIRREIKGAQDQHRVIAERCEHDCKSCIISQRPDIYRYCESCDDKGEDCSSMDVQIEPLTRYARGLWGKGSDGKVPRGLIAGLSIGLLRGSAMCGRLAFMIPLAVKGSVLNSLLISSAFALSSSIYPLLAMFTGEYIMRLVKYRNAIIIANSIFMIILSLFYFSKAFIKGL